MNCSLLSSAFHHKFLRPRCSLFLYSRCSVCRLSWCPCGPLYHLLSSVLVSVRSSVSSVIVCPGVRAVLCIICYRLSWCPCGPLYHLLSSVLVPLLCFLFCPGVPCCPLLSVTCPGVQAVLYCLLPVQVSKLSSIVCYLSRCPSCPLLSVTCPGVQAVLYCLLPVQVSKLSTIVCYLSWCPPLISICYHLSWCPHCPLSVIICPGVPH